MMPISETSWISRWRRQFYQWWFLGCSWLLGMWAEVPDQKMMLIMRSKVHRTGDRQFTWVGWINKELLWLNYSHVVYIGRGFDLSQGKIRLFAHHLFITLERIFLSYIKMQQFLFHIKKRHFWNVNESCWYFCAKKIEFEYSTVLPHPKPVSFHNQAPMNTYDLRIKWAMEVYLFGENADLSV